MGYSDPQRQREYQREWVAKRRAEYFADKSCVVCGNTNDLQLHHLDPAQKISHNIWGWRRERMEAEIAKCEVRCSACHRKHHYVLWRKHGIGTYMKKGCRCFICYRAKAAATRRETRYGGGAS